MTPTLNLYLLTQDDEEGYDTWDSCVVAAEDEHKARLIHPREAWSKNSGWGSGDLSGWAHKPENVKVLFIGIAASDIEAGVVLASFNAG